MHRRGQSDEKMRGGEWRGEKCLEHAEEVARATVGARVRESVSRKSSFKETDYHTYTATRADGDADRPTAGVWKHAPQN